MATSISNLIRRLRILINDQNDLEYTDKELLGYINDAVGYLSTYLISTKDPEMVKEISITQDIDVPDDYCSFSGSYPVYISDNKFKLYDPSATVTARYFATKKTDSVVADNLPFKDIYAPVIIRVASVYALNRNEFNVTQDVTIISQMLDSIKAAKS